MPARTDQLQFAQALVERARSEGVELMERPQRTVDRADEDGPGDREAV